MPGDGKRIVTAPGGKEVYPVDSEKLIQKKNFQGLNMSGAKPVKVVSDRKNK